MRQRLRAVRAQQGNDGGFTLTELLIVIVILGVLTGIVVFAVGAFTNRGEVAACRTAMKTVETAIEAYRAQNSGAAPASIDVLRGVGGGQQYLRTEPDTAEYNIEIGTGGVVNGTLTDAQPAAAGGTTTNCLLANP